MSTPTITEVTRRDIVDDLRLRKTVWNGRLDEGDFLRRIFKLN